MWHLGDVLPFVEHSAPLQICLEHWKWQALLNYYRYLSTAPALTTLEKVLELQCFNDKNMHWAFFLGLYSTYYPYLLKLWKVCLKYWKMWGFVILSCWAERDLLQCLMKSLPTKGTLCQSRRKQCPLVAASCYETPSGAAQLSIDPPLITVRGSCQAKVCAAAQKRKQNHFPPQFEV